MMYDGPSAFANVLVVTLGFLEVYITVAMEGDWYALRCWEQSWCTSRLKSCAYVFHLVEHCRLGTHA